MDNSRLGCILVIQMICLQIVCNTLNSIGGTTDRRKQV